MEYLIFSDLHVHKHLSRSIFEDTAIDFLEYILQYCLDNKIKNILFLGDFYHLKSKLYVPSFIRSIEVLDRIKKAGIHITFLIGNHDMPLLNSTEHSIVRAFSPYGEVVTDYNWYDIEDKYRFHFLSYTHELPEFEIAKNKKNILFGHLDINSFQMDGIICNDGFAKQDFKSFDMVFSGHYHSHQSRGNIIYVGSPYQVRYSERNDIKGFVRYITDDNSWKFIVYDDAPKFTEVPIETPEDIELDDIKGNFVRIKTSKDNIDLETIKQKLLDAGAASVEFIFEETEQDGTLDVLDDLSLGSMGTLASDYFDNMLNNGLIEPVLQESLTQKLLSKDGFLKVFEEIKEAELTGWAPTAEEKNDI
jgi:DNA repair exonuclease SbcCD nuclease subunit